MAKTTVFIGNLSFDATKEEVMAMCKTCGTVLSIRMRKNSGHALVEMTSPEEAEAVIGLLDGKDQGGRQLRATHEISAKKAKPKAVETFKKNKMAARKLQRKAFQEGSARDGRNEKPGSRKGLRGKNRFQPREDARERQRPGEEGSFHAKKRFGGGDRFQGKEKFGARKNYNPAGPRDNRNDYGQERFHNERKSYGQDRFHDDSGASRGESYGREGGFRQSRDRKPFGAARGFENRGGDKPFGRGRDRKPFGQYAEKKSFSPGGEKRSYGSGGEKKPFRQYDEKRSFSQDRGRKPFGNDRGFGGSPERKPFGRDRGFGKGNDRKPFGGESAGRAFGRDGGFKQSRDRKPFGGSGFNKGPGFKKPFGGKSRFKDGPPGPFKKRKPGKP